MMLVVIHYDEIAIKGKNRSAFEHVLKNNIRFALKDISTDAYVHIKTGRILLEIPNDIEPRLVEERLKSVFGIAYFAWVFSTNPFLDEVKRILTERLLAIKNTPSLNDARSFAVRVKRENKEFCMTSLEIAKELGDVMETHTGLKVDLRRPDILLHVEWTRERVLFFWERIPCSYGLPIGVTGKVACLLSGGIDSPVASYIMMKRGCMPVFIHFHSFPYTDEASQTKVKELAEFLCKYRCDTSLYLVPFAEVQKEIVVSAPSAYRTVLYRRFMFRMAEEIAQKENAEALVTGESLGQVASQTLPNLITIGNSVKMAVLRPLIGFSKNDIIKVAEQIGTFPISIQPHDDCCQFLGSRMPATHSSEEELKKIEEGIDFSKCVAQAMQETVIYKINSVPDR